MTFVTDPRTSSRIINRSPNCELHSFTANENSATLAMIQATLLKLDLDPVRLRQSFSKHACSSPCVLD